MHSALYSLLPRLSAPCSALCALRSVLRLRCVFTLRSTLCALCLVLCARVCASADCGINKILNASPDGAILRTKCPKMQMGYVIGTHGLRRGRLNFRTNHPRYCRHFWRLSRTSLDTVVTSGTCHARSSILSSLLATPTRAP